MQWCKNVRHLTRAAFLADPPLAKYANIWDIDILLNYLGTLHPESDLPIQVLARKTCSLLAVLFISRSSSLVALVPTYQVVNGEVQIPIQGLEKPPDCLPSAGRLGKINEKYNQP